MMNKFQTIPFLAISTLLLCTLFSSCKKDDVSFTFSPTDPCAGATVYFTNNTSEGEEWSWTFGDGSTSTSKSPRHVYRQPGDYSVILKVDNKASRTCTRHCSVHKSERQHSIYLHSGDFYRPVLQPVLLLSQISLGTAIMRHNSQRRYRITINNRVFPRARFTTAFLLPP